MYKILVLFFVLSLATLSCKKDTNSDSNSDSGTDFTEITLNGQTYREEHPAMKLIGWDNQVGCQSLPYSKYIMEQFESSTFDFDVNIKHYRNNRDFSQSQTGTYGIVSDYVNGSLSCNLDLTVTFSDKIVGYDTLQSSARNKVASITEYSSTSTNIFYTVQGEFSCSFRTNTNVLVPITGTYKHTVKTLK